MGHLLNAVLCCSAVISMVGCGEKPHPPSQKELALPTTLAEPHVTDQLSIAGVNVTLWDDNGGCKLKIAEHVESVWLKPMAPCYFMRTPASPHAEVFRHDKETYVAAAVGTPTKQARCGQQVQGIIVKKNKVTLSNYLMEGSVYCADQGLQNYQYGLFVQ